VNSYAEITGDSNPAHLDEEFAKGTVFKGRIAQGILSAGLISAVIGTRLPGSGTIYLSQTLRFTAPVRLGDAITAMVEVIDIDIEKNRATLHTTCVNQDGKMVIDGEANVMLPL